MDVCFKKYDSLKFHISQLGSLHILNSGSYYLYSCQLQQEFLPFTALPSNYSLWFANTCSHH